MTTLGLDLSHYQPTSFNLAAAQGEGVQFVILKAGQGTATDAAFAARLAQARAAGLLIAAYWYQMGNVSGGAQVAKIQSTVPRDLPVILDVENNSGDVELTRFIVNALRAQGRRVPLLYLPKWYWQQIGSPDLSGLPPLWSSRYPDYVVRSLPAALAKIPNSYWTGYGGLPVAMVQMTSSARVAGYSPLDANVHPGSRADVAALFGTGGGPAPAQTPASVPPMEECMATVEPGTGVKTTLFTAGRPHFLWIEVSDGRKVTVDDVTYVRRTTSDPNKRDGDYGPLGTPGYPDLRKAVFDADRPGPIQFADDVAFIRIITSSDYEHTIAVG